METLLLYDPWVRFHLLWVGAFGVVFICQAGIPDSGKIHLRESRDPSEQHHCQKKRNSNSGSVDDVHKTPQHQSAMVLLQR